MTAPTERFWEDLLLFIEEGKVIPVVGPELVTVRDGEQDVLLYRWLARRLAEAIELPAADLPAACDLNDVVSLYLRCGGEREDLYSRILRILRDAKPVPSPALLALAGIPRLDLFVSLTFDSLLAEAIAIARPGAAPLQLAYQTKEVHDLQAAPSALRPLVYHLLGRVSSTPDYVICDEDLLEFVHALQDKQRLPLKLFDELRAKHLLILGCSFGDWLLRFFLRTARGLELSQKRKRWDVLADAHSSSDAELAVFLASFSTDTKVLDMPAAAFVGELARRWHQAHPSAPADAPANSTAGHTADAGPRDGAVFVSYASENRAAAERLADGLRAARLDVWFDKNALQVADDWAQSIQRGIGRCALFLPVISRESLSEANHRRYFWREWNAAHDLAKGMAQAEPFIVPVVVDDTRLDRSALPDTFRSKQGVTLPGGDVTPELAERLQAIVKAFHRRNAAR
ncbi:MAG: toll/interleukin-1 receptor domain-containing protein [Candidatus Accumulibacter sp.]|nr:toll/interleukin-1 receptor domain-containing protein [Accumulibacter sp.]